MQALVKSIERGFACLEFLTFLSIDKTQTLAILYATTKTYGLMSQCTWVALPHSWYWKEYFHYFTG